MKTITILPTIYTLEVVSHSHNHYVRSFCLECLSRSKTNKEYTQYWNSNSISQNRVCCRCGAMTLAAVINAFNITTKHIIAIAERQDNYLHFTDGERYRFAVDKTYLTIIKDRENGKESKFRRPNR